MNLLTLQKGLKVEIINALQQLGYYDETIHITIETPKDKSNGDLSTNVAMQYARIARKAPRIIAKEVIDTLDVSSLPIKTIDIAGPGFINFFIKTDFLQDIIPTIIQKGQAYGALTLKQDTKVNIEFVSVNPTGALHIGHARGAAAGDSLARIMTKAGYDVTKEYYVNDGGNQIDKLAKSIEARYKQLFDVAIEIPEDGYHGQDIVETAKAFKAAYGDKYINEDGYDIFKSFGVDTLLNELKEDLNRFNVSFDVWFHEKSLYQNNDIKNTLTLLKDKGYTYEKDGAIWLKTSEFNDEKDRVIIKSDGTYTYLTPDIAYHHNKIKRGFDKLVDILGADHHGYIDRLKAAIEIVSGKKDILDVDILQMVKVIQDGKEVKMSKRSGKAITLRDLLDEVGKDPIRYFFAARSLNTQMDLDLDLAIRKTTENPVYYVQYAGARIHSVFVQAEKEGITLPSNITTFDTLNNEKINELLSILAAYPETIESSALSRSPHKLTIYIHKLATAFHSLYNNEKFITDNLQKTHERLALLKATQIVLTDALSLIGVSVPKKM
ncbi:MAG: arginine--tRNA ligase [Candidatus Izimaplasma sp.]|nr:arginine--tRNA ligase [Candidatus Izimaplasma bacterium]